MIESISTAGKQIRNIEVSSTLLVKILGSTSVNRALPSLY